MFIEFYAALVDGSTWTHIFTLDETVTWAEKVIRPAIVYLALILLLRFFGKRELAQLNPMDLVVILSLSNTVQNAIIGQDNSLIGGVVGAAALLAINYLIARLKWSSPKIETLTEGPPATLIENGKIRVDQMKRELITHSDLEIVAQSNGFETSRDIEKMILHPNGSFLVDGKDELKDATFKIEIMKKIDALAKQLDDLSKSSPKGAA